MTRLLFACLLLCCSALVLAQDKRPITHEDLWLMPRVAAPVASPDGKWVVFTLTEPAYEAEGQTVDLWLAPTDGSVEPRRITATRAPESGPSWSPDSRRIAFSAQRNGDSAPQIYILDLERGGEAQRATSISTGARLPQFSPDGRRILFTSNLYPEAASDEDSKRIAEERKARKYSVRTYTGFPIRNWDRWIDERQPRLFVQTIGQDDARDLLGGTALIRSPGFGGRGTNSGEELDAIWAPDGRSIVFIASSNRHRAAFAFTHTDLWQVSVDGGEPRRLTGPQDDSAGDGYAQPRFSPDGRTLYALMSPRSDSVYNATRLAGFAWPTLRPQPVIELPEGRSVSTFTIAPDSRAIHISAEDAGHEKIYRATAGRAGASLAFDMQRGLYTALSGATRGAPVLVGLYESSTEPPEVVRIDPSRGTHHRLSRFAVDRAAALDLQPAEHFWFTSERGARIHNMLIRPAGFDPNRRYPLFVVMHGGPHTMWRDMWVLRWHYHLLAGSDYVVLLTNYTGSTGFSEAFARGIQGDPLKGPAEEINQAADVAIARYGFIDGDRQCAGGASYGGHLANWLQASTDRYRCLVSHAGLVNLKSQWGTSDIAYSREVGQGGPHWEDIPLWQEQNPIRYAANFKTPVLVTFGENDFRVPINNGLEYWVTLQRQQVESRLVVFPEENHWILRGENSRHFYREVGDWLGRWLGEAAQTAP